MLVEHWFRHKGLSQDQQNLIQTPGAKYYNDLYNACVKAKKKEYDDGTTKNPFYEPSTFYGSFKEAHYHNNYTHAGSRLASSLSCYFHEYLNAKRPTLRFLREPSKYPEYSEMIKAVNLAGGNAWLFIITVSEATIPYYSMHDTAYHAILAKYPKTEDEFLKNYIEFRELVNQSFKWFVRPWDALDQKLTFDLSKYSSEHRGLLEQAIECINSLIHYNSWRFIGSKGLMKEYSIMEFPNKAEIVDALFTTLTSKNIFENSWVISEITSLAESALKPQGPC